MKKLLLNLICFCAILTSFAQSTSINYKAQINDDAGNPLDNQAVTIRFSITDASFLSSFYSETHATNTNANGLVVLNIGEGVVVSGDYDAIDWSSNDHFLNVEVDSGSGFVDLGTSEFHAVPYALNAINGVQSLDDLSDVRNIGGSTSSMYIGHTAASSTGSGNTSVGNAALLSNTTGNGNVALGYNALVNNLIGSDNIAIGRDALVESANASNNIAIGAEALLDSETGIGNLAIGLQAMLSNQSGSLNIGLGSLVMLNNIEGSGNIGIGSASLTSNTTGDGNIALGNNAMASSTIANNNVAIGNNALSNLLAGTNNIAIGQDAQVTLGNASNQIRMGNSAITSANIQVSWTTTSDRRWKKDIRTLPYGLDFVKQLQPVDYVRKNNDTKTRETGFIAQDVEALLQNVGYTDQGLLTKDDEGRLSLRYNDFIAILVKALQEQQQLIETQELLINKQNHTVKTQGEDMASMSAKLDRLEALNDRLTQLEALLNN